MPDSKEFARLACESFGLGNEEGRGQENPVYIDSPSILREGNLLKTLHKGDSCLTDPLVFLGYKENLEPGNKYSYTTSRRIPGQYLAPSPSLSIIVGQYGYGKTELVHQLCCQLIKAYEPEEFAPLPINLSTCRKNINVLNKTKPPELKEFLYFLFGELLQKFGFSEEFLHESLVSNIRRGSILLILDGLDELLTNIIQHVHFFSGLAKLICPFPSSSAEYLKSRVVVCTRLEYMSAIDPQAGQELVKAVKGEDECSSILKVFFLSLDCFDDMRVEHYLRKRIINAENFIQEVKGNSRLIDILRRPLLIRIFCDLATQHISSSWELERLLKIEHAGELLELFTSQASADKKLAEAQKNIADFTWDINKLAYKALEIYRDGQSEIPVTDIMDVIIPVGNNNDGTINPEQIIQGVHKCPFLSRASDLSVKFSHRSFLEFFTAKGITLSHIEHNDSAPFDELVLNVDTRKFLKYLINRSHNSQDAFDNLTRNSYGLLNEEEWNLNPNSDIDFNELEKIREKLLFSMTEPEKIVQSDVENIIERFLSIESQGLHPRYLLYSYEAVAVYIRDRQWEIQGKLLSEIFSNKLKIRMNEIIEELSKANTPKTLYLPLELLAERILDIAQRLRYNWVKSYLEENTKHKLFEVVRSHEIRERISMTMKRIKYSVF